MDKCSLCKRAIVDDFINLSISEHFLHESREILEAIFCSVECFRNFFAAGRKFKTLIKPPEEEEDLDEYVLKQDHYLTGEAFFYFCAYCGRVIDNRKDYYVNFFADGVLDGKSVLLYVISFCSGDCLNNASKLGVRFLELAAALDSYGPERYIRQELERDKSLQ